MYIKMAEYRLPPGFEDLDYIIMNEMDDAQLLSYCLTDQRSVRLCSNEVFWKNRTLSRYSLLAKFRKDDETWYEFYRRIYHDAYYIANVDGSLYTYTDIGLAYDKLINEVQLSENLLINKLSYEELIKFDFDNHEFLDDGDYQILVMFKNEPLIFGGGNEVMEGPNILLHISGSQRYFDPSLILYPKLAPSGPLLFTVDDRYSSTSKSKFLALNSQNLTKHYEKFCDARRLFVIFTDSGKKMSYWKI